MTSSINSSNYSKHQDALLHHNWATENTIPKKMDPEAQPSKLVFSKN
jgi:hypothetical protein